MDTLRWPFIVPTDYLVLRKLLAKMSCYQQIAVSAICNGPFISFHPVEELEQFTVHTAQAASVTLPLVNQFVFNY